MEFSHIFISPSVVHIRHSPRDPWAAGGTDGGVQTPRRSTGRLRGGYFGPPPPESSPVKLLPIKGGGLLPGWVKPPRTPHLFEPVQLLL